MSTLNLYIFRQVAFSSILSISLFTFLLLMGNAVKDVVRLLATGYLDWIQFFRIIGSLVPWVVSYSLPLGMLTGVLLVLGRLSSQNEITAMRGAGLSLWRITSPIFALAVLGAALSIMINNYYAPNAKSAYRQSLRETVGQDPLKAIVAKTFIREFTGRIIYIGEKDGATMEDFWIWQLDERRYVHQLVRAESGELHFDEAEDALILTLFNGYAEDRDIENPNDLRKPMVAGSFQKARIKLPLSRFLGGGTYHRKISRLNFNELITERRATLQDEELDSQEISQRVTRLQTQVQKNFSMAFSVLSFAFLGIPLGIKVRRSETYANFMLALGLAFGFYFLVIIVGWLEKRPEWRPDLLIWIPNLLFQALGLFLFKRVNGQ